MEASGQPDASAALAPGKEPGTHSKRGSVDPKGGLDIKRKLPVFEPRTVQPVAYE